MKATILKAALIALATLSVSAPAFAHEWGRGYGNRVFRQDARVARFERARAFEFRHHFYGYGRPVYVGPRFGCGY